MLASPGSDDPVVPPDAVAVLEEVPIDYLQRTGRSKITPWDAGTFAVLILRTAMLFHPLRVFLPLVMLSLLYGVTKMTLDLIRDPNISASAQLAFMSALLILLIGMIGDAISTRLGRLSPNAVASARPRDWEELTDEEDA